MTRTPTDAAQADSTDSVVPGSSNQAELTRPITIVLPDDILKKLKIVAILKETSVSELVAEVATGVVKREMKKALSKLSLE